jgi:hypothetical protein
MTATLFAKAGPATLFLSWRLVRLTKLGRRLANVNYFFLREQPCDSRYERRRSPRRFQLLQLRRQDRAYQI